MFIFSSLRSILIVALCAAIGLCACDEFDASDELLGLGRVPTGTMEVGLGQNTLNLQPCVVRHSESEEVIQVVGWDESTMRVYLELPGHKRPRPPFEGIQPTLAMIKTPKALSDEEQPIYRGHDSSVIFESFEDERAKGRISGRIEDLLFGRTHEIRATFDCRLERPP